MVTSLTPHLGLLFLVSLSVGVAREEETCRDLNVTKCVDWVFGWDGQRSCARSIEVPWEYSGLLGLSSRSCEWFTFSHEQEVFVDAAATTFFNQAWSTVSGLQELTGLKGSSILAKTLGVLHGLLTGGTMVLAIQNKCSAYVIGEVADNAHQLYRWYGATDFNSTFGQHVLTSSQACCACGGGTSRWKGANQSITQALDQFYSQLNGPFWTNQEGWSPSRHYCTRVSCYTPTSH